MFTNARDAIDGGIATVFQDLAMIPMMSVTRNFFLGREPKRAFGPIKLFDFETANRVAMEEMMRMGIRLRGPIRPLARFPAASANQLRSPARSILARAF